VTDYSLTFQVEMKISFSSWRGANERRESVKFAIAEIKNASLPVEYPTMTTTTSERETKQKKVDNNLLQFVTHLTLCAEDGRLCCFLRIVFISHCERETLL
jgi:hypothetical protein